MWEDWKQEEANNTTRWQEVRRDGFRSTKSPIELETRAVRQKDERQCWVPSSRWGMDRIM